MMKTGVQLAFVGGSMLSSMRDREGWTGQTWGCAPTSLEMCIWGCFSVGDIVLTVNKAGLGEKQKLSLLPTFRALVISYGNETNLQTPRVSSPVTC